LNKIINPLLISFQDYFATNSNQFDLIVSNPPFFKNSIKTINKLRNLARHNDMLSNTDLLEGSSELLTVIGRLAIILPYAEGCVFIAQAVRYGMFCIRRTNVKTKPASTVKRLLLEFSKKPEKCVEEVLVIGTKSSQKYSEQYRQLTKDFYLLF
jgi:tRNA1Val (adenine37-N6)-methyltransferase